jgi:hypothetical protein
MTGLRLTRKDVAGYAFAALVLALAFGAVLIGTRFKMTAGFLRGPGWDCINPGKGEPVCVRYPVKSNDDRSESIAPRP